MKRTNDILITIVMICMICQIHLILSPTFAQETSFDSRKDPIVDEFEGVYLEINKSNNMLYVYLNDHIMYTFPVATGASKAHTPEGTFLIVTKVENPWYLPKQIRGGSPKNPLGTRWMGLNVPGNNGFKYGLHGTNNPASIGHHVSQGCIRMHNHDVEWLYEHIPIGTYVRIIDESP